MAPSPNMFYQPAADGGQRLYLHHPPAVGTPLRGALLYVHPWAEEMNKSRRMVALMARAAAHAGWAVLQVDLHGCGDSSGDFGDASWDGWAEDVVAAAHWMRQAHPSGPLWLWGLRCGALVCAAAAARLDPEPHLLFWQPVHQGRQVLQHFLRMKAAAQLAHGGGKAIVESAWAELSAGRPVDVGGYALGPDLARGLEGAVLAPPEARHGPGAALRRLVWIEVSRQPTATLSPAAQAALPIWADAGWHTTARVTSDAPFWQTTEIETVPALIDATLDALAAGPVPPSRQFAPA